MVFKLKSLKNRSNLKTKLNFNDIELIVYDFDGVMKTHFFNRSYFGCAPQEPPTHALNTGNYLLYWTVSRFGPHDNSGIIEIFIPETDTLELTIEY